MKPHEPPRNVSYVLTLLFLLLFCNTCSTSSGTDTAPIADTKYVWIIFSLPLVPVVTMSIILVLCCTNKEYIAHTFFEEPPREAIRTSSNRFSFLSRRRQSGDNVTSDKNRNTVRNQDMIPSPLVSERCELIAVTPGPITSTPGYLQRRYLTPVHSDLDVRHFRFPDPLLSTQSRRSHESDNFEDDTDRRQELSVCDNYSNDEDEHYMEDNELYSLSPRVLSTSDTRLNRATSYNSLLDSPPPTKQNIKEKFVLSI